MSHLRAGLAFLLLGVIALSLPGCAWRAPFNQYSFDETARLKSESTALLRQANESYERNQRNAEALMANVNKAYQDARLRALNEESMQVWVSLLDTSKPSLAGALHRWKTNDTLSVAQRREFQNTIARHFDDISKLEGGKRK